MKTYDILFIVRHNVYVRLSIDCILDKDII